MEQITDLIAYVKANWVAISAILLATVRLVEAIIVATKTKKDDAILAKVKEILKQYFKLGWD